MVYKEFRHSRENLIALKSFFLCLKLGNMHAQMQLLFNCRIGGEKYCVACSPGRVRCNNDHVMEGVTIYQTEQIK